VSQQGVQTKYMRRALALAKKGLTTTMPNPRVGCVIVNENEIVGEGFHRYSGGQHAEIAALEKAGEKAYGSTVYITLEPCNFEGKTGACSLRLLEAGVKRIVVAMKDPNPRVNGKSLKEFENSGIEVNFGVLEGEARELNLGFTKRMETGLPWLRVKVASSIDGFTALRSGNSKWITGARARRDGHIWRARSCAVLTGVGTLMSDNPLLNVRAIKTDRQPVKVLVDPFHRTDFSLDFFKASKVIIASLKKNDSSSIYNSKFSNIELLEFNPKMEDPEKFSLRSLMLELGNREFNEVQVEAGFRLTSEFFSEGLIDEFIVYISPRFLVDGLGFLGASVKAGVLSDKPGWKIKEAKLIGGDLRVILRPVLKFT